MRELGMWDSDGGIGTAFQDLLELTRACRFSNCTHTAEPGCAVLKALADGTLDAGRWESFRKLKLENASAAERSRYLDAKSLAELLHKIYGEPQPGRLRQLLKRRPGK